MAFGQLCAPISDFKSDSYAGSSSRIPTDPTGERRNWQFCQHFRGLRSCRPNPSGESGVIADRQMWRMIPKRYRNQLIAYLKELGMRDLVADWKKWSFAERLLAM